jgi:hypothetical protein
LASVAQLIFLSVGDILTPAETDFLHVLSAELITTVSTNVVVPA